MDDSILCNKCQLLTLHVLEQGHLLYTQVIELRDEAERDGGCVMCSLIWWSLQDYHFDILNDGRAPVRLFLNPPQSGTNKSPKFHRIDVIVTNRIISEFTWSRGTNDEPWHLGPPDYKSDIFRGHLRLYGTYGDPSQQYLKYRSISTDAESDTCFKIAKIWLDQCVQSHGSLCQVDILDLPTRLVDVGPPDNSIPPKLVITKTESSCDSQAVKYVALSYCWGNIPSLTLTTSNIEALTTSIPWDDIPKTIRDAIIVTRRLGIRYLWVDALCIIQGDDPVSQMDWQNESTRMEQTYRGAVLTIAAGSAEDSHQGIFRKRPSRQMPYCALRSDSRYPGTALVGPDPPQLGHAEPLDSRAWVLQEKHLSNRVLTYGTTELSWMCRKSFHTEGAPELEVPELRFMSQDTPADNSDPLSKWIYERWMGIVEDYSRRDLTYASDKLPAIAGLASMANRAGTDKYVAGLWHSKLEQQLLWRHYGKQNDGSVEHGGQTHFRAPSWSWASVDGSIRFLHGHLAIAGTTITCSLDIAKSSQVAEMKKRPLHLLGVVRKIPTIRCETSAKYFGGYDQHLPWACHPESLRTYLDDVNNLPSNGILDLTGRPKELLNTFFLFLGYKQVSKFPYIELEAGLILLQVNKLTSTFRRVGVFEGFLRISEDRKALRKGDRRKWISII